VRSSRAECGLGTGHSTGSGVRVGCDKSGLVTAEPIAHKAVLAVQKIMIQGFRSR